MQAVPILELKITWFGKVIEGRPSLNVSLERLFKAMAYCEPIARCDVALLGKNANILQKALLFQQLT